MKLGSKTGCEANLCFHWSRNSVASVSTQTLVSLTHWWALLRRAINSKVVVANPFGGMNRRAWGSVRTAWETEWSAWSRNGSRLMLEMQALTINKLIYLISELPLLCFYILRFFNLSTLQRLSTPVISLTFRHFLNWCLLFPFIISTACGLTGFVQYSGHFLGINSLKAANNCYILQPVGWIPRRA